MEDSAADSHGSLWAQVPIQEQGISQGPAVFPFQPKGRTRGAREEAVFLMQSEMTWYEPVPVYPLPVSGALLKPSAHSFPLPCSSSALGSEVTGRSADDQSDPKGYKEHHR